MTKRASVFIFAHWSGQNKHISACSTFSSSLSYVVSSDLPRVLNSTSCSVRFTIRHRPVLQRRERLVPESTACQSPLSIGFPLIYVKRLLQRIGQSGLLKSMAVVFSAI